jgi:hypothetical protein
MVEGGPFGLKADEADLMRRFVRWHEQGEYSCTGSSTSASVRSTLTTTLAGPNCTLGRTAMHFLGGLLLVIVIFWLATRVAGPKAGVGAAAVTTVALMMLNSEGHNHHHHDRLDYDA